MLVTFKTAAYANITMFGDVAVRLLRFMGHSGKVPGAILAEDIPEALERLKAAVEANPNMAMDPQGSKERDGEEVVHVSLKQRALPLIELLSAAAAAEKNVMWES